MSVLGTNIVCQIGLVVNDIRKTGQAWADFFGVPLPEVVGSGDDEVVQGEVYGQRSDASCQMMFFDAENVQIELIQPDEKPSAWRNILNERGEGLHHLAFQIKDSEGLTKTLVQKGWPEMQKGNYGSGTGMFTYIDSRKDLKLIIELLESF